MQAIAPHNNSTHERREGLLYKITDSEMRNDKSIKQFALQIRKDRRANTEEAKLDKARTRLAVYALERRSPRETLRF